MADSNIARAAVKPRSRAEIFGALIRDRRISHGAFRLLHLLRDHQNPRTGLCCPGRRSQMEALGSDHHSLKRWTDELVAAGWLKIETVERGELFRYTLLDGAGEPWLKSPTPPRGGNTPHLGCGANPPRSVVQKPHGVWCKSTTKPIGARRAPYRKGNLPKPAKPGLASPAASQPDAGLKELGGDQW